MLGLGCSKQGWETQQSKLPVRQILQLLFEF
jgi:hypothetical protein